MASPRVRPIILAGGLGTRLRPRTNVLPKPLLPVLGRPLLWYALNAVNRIDLEPPLIALDYKSELIMAYFHGSRADFRELKGASMAEAFLTLAEGDDADAFLGMSSDVILARTAVDICLDEFRKGSFGNTVILTQLPQAGHKKWEFVIDNGFLTDVRRCELHTHFERILLVFTKSAIRKLRDLLPHPVTEDALPITLKGYQSGWTLLLKTLALSGVPVVARMTEIAICNINIQSDLDSATAFIEQYGYAKD